MTDQRLREGMASLLALAVHDLRNPLATISANVEYVQAMNDASRAAPALEDVQAAANELSQGLEQLSWVGRWIAGQPAMDPSPSNVQPAIRAALRTIGEDVRTELPAEPIAVLAGGEPLRHLVEILVRNSLTFAGVASSSISAEAEAAHAVVRIQDGGRALAEELRELAFTLEGQRELKGRSDGRYSRVAGLVAARALADAMGAQICARGADGAAIFEIRMPLA